MSKNLDFNLHFGKTYVCIEGPYFSTQAESLSYIQMGAHIIGMTNFPEFALAREAGLGYVPCSFVTDYDCWDDSIEHVTLAEVLEVMRKNNSKAFSLIEKLLQVKPDQKLDYASQGLKTGLLTPYSAIPAHKKEWVEVLRRLQ